MFRFAGFQVCRISCFQVFRFAGFQVCRFFRFSCLQVFLVFQVFRFSGFQVCRFSGLQVFPVFRFAGFSGFSGFQVFRFAGFSGLQVLQVLQIIRFSGLQVFQVFRFSGLQVLHVFRFQVPMQVCRCSGFHSGFQVFRFACSSGFQVPMQAFRLSFRFSGLHIFMQAFRFSSFHGSGFVQVVKFSSHHVFFCTLGFCFIGLHCLLQDLPLSKVRKLAGHHKMHSSRLRRFSRIGTEGKYLNNMYRDMWRLLRKSHAVEPMMIRVPMKTRHIWVQVIRRFRLFMFQEGVYFCCCC